MLLDQKSLLDILQNDNVEALESDLEIEDIITLVKDVENKIDFLGKLKKKRTEVIDVEIEKLNDKKNKFKSIILKTLEKFGHKSLNFPGIGKVGVKNFSGKWEIKNEEKMIDYLQNNLVEKDLANIFTYKPSVSKKELNKLLDDFIATGKDIKDFAEKTQDEKSVSISYDKTGTIDTNSVPEIEEKSDSTVDLKSQYDGVEF
jgi:hypothetical protein